MKNLLSLLAIPIITISSFMNSGCMYGDQVRIPDGKVNRYEINGDKIKMYSNTITNIFHGSDILEVRKKDGSKITYIGWYRSKDLDFIEEGGLFGKRYNIHNLPDEKKTKVENEYKFYLDEISKEKARQKLEQQNKFNK